MNRYLELTKPRITLFILMSTGVGFLFGTHLGQPWTWMELFHTLLGTMLIAGGTAALNQWCEREGDGLMNRTKARPIPSGRITADHALTFGTLLWILHASPEVFRTGWFVESLLTELVIALVVRTRRPFFRSRPGTVLLTSTMILIPIAFAIPYAPFAPVFGFVPLPASLLAVIAGITALYVAATELLKRRFYA